MRTADFKNSSEVGLVAYHDFTDFVAVINEGLIDKVNFSINSDDSDAVFGGPN